MKLPFDFANKLLLRLVLPGALLTAMLWPLILATVEAVGIDVADKVLIPVAIVLFGWLMMFVDMPLYMIAEGRRYWLSPLWNLGVKYQTRRLARLQARYAGASGPLEKELALRVRAFPLDAKGRPHAPYPTRLGNLITASETYPDRKYGIDGVFGWYRLWIVIDKDLRAELDDRQAIADSALYSAFIAGAASITCLGYALTRQITGTAVIDVLPATPILLGLAATCLVSARLLYAACLMVQAQHGELFCALFDQNIEKLKFDRIITELAAAKQNPGLLTAAEKTKARAAIRFLKWHMYRPPGQLDNDVVDDW